MVKAKVKINQSICIGLSVLEFSKTVMYEFQFNYIKPKDQDKANLCYMNIDSFIVNVKDVYKNIANDVDERFDTSNYKTERLLLTVKNQKVIGVMMHEFGEKIMMVAVVKSIGNK